MNEEVQQKTREREKQKLEIIYMRYISCMTSVIFFCCTPKYLLPSENHLFSYGCQNQILASYSPSYRSTFFAFPPGPVISYGFFSYKNATELAKWAYSQFPPSHHVFLCYLRRSFFCSLVSDSRRSVNPEIHVQYCTS